VAWYLLEPMPKTAVLCAIACFPVAVGGAQPATGAGAGEPVTRAPSVAPEPQEPKQLTLLVTGELLGRFRDIDCIGRADAPSFANLVGALDAVRTQLAARGAPEPVVVTTGNTIRPHALARFVLARGDSGARELVGWLERTRLDYLALGEEDFLSVPSRLHSFLRACRAAGLWTGAANLDCDSTEGLCGLLERPQRFRLLERGRSRIAIAALAPADLAVVVPQSHLEGVTVADPLTRAREVIAEARGAGADLILLLAQLDDIDSAPRQAVNLARALAAPDVLVVGGRFQAEPDVPGIAAIRFNNDAPPVVGGAIEGRGLTRINLVLEDGVWLAQVDPVDVAAAAPHRTVAERLEAVHRDYCDEWLIPVGEGTLDSPMGPDPFSDYLMEVMRHETESEIAFVPERLLDRHSVFPITGSITRHDFFSGIPHRNTLFTFRLSDAEVRRVCGALSDEVRSRGLDCAAMRVNGRPLRKGDSFRAVTVEYLATGALGLFPELAPRMVEWDPSGTGAPPILGQIARDFLAGPAFRQPGPIDPGVNFPDLSQRLRWTFEGTLDVNLSDTRVRTRPAYTETQLASGREFFSVRGEARGKIAANSEVHGLAMDGWVKYAQGRGPEDAGFSEVDDLVTVEALYKLNLLRDAGAEWWVPAPYASGKVETELDAPEEGRDFHHLELTGTLGLRFPILPELEAKAAAGARKEILDRSAESFFGIDFGFALSRLTILSIVDTPIELESDLTAFFGGNTGSVSALKGTWINRLYVNLTGQLFFNVTHDLFFYAEMDNQLALASQLTAGLSLRASTSRQTF
jgi:hypothetical protein